MALHNNDPSLFWLAVAYLCATYVFLGLVWIGFALASGDNEEISLSIIAYLLNLYLLGYARKRAW